MNIPELANMNIWAIMQIFRQRNGYDDEELRTILNDKLLELPLDTQIERLRTETNSELRELLESSIAKRYSMDNRTDINKALPKWYFNNLTSIDAANILTCAEDEKIRTNAEEKYLELLDRYLSEFEGKEEIAFYEGKLGRLVTLPKDTSPKKETKKTKIYQFRRNEE